MAEDRPPWQRFQLDAVAVDADAPTAMFRQLEDQLREAIWRGSLRAGERLPSSRRLAKELRISRNTVLSAYEQLAVEGFIVATNGSGTRVADSIPPYTAVRPSRGAPSKKSVVEHDPPPVSKRTQRLLATGFHPPLCTMPAARPFRPHTPACSEFPAQLWAQLTARLLSRHAQTWLEESSPCGYGRLREAVAGHLGAARGLVVEPEQVVITAGTQQSLVLIGQLLIDPGDRVCIEDPGYTPAASAFEMMGAEIVRIPVDDQGIDVDRLQANVTHARLIYTTPASQFPLGMTLSQPRRMQLLEWAHDSGAIVLEDDYSGEYRYRGRPLPTLHAMAAPGKVIYLGSFSKLLFPSLRLGYVVLDRALVDSLATLRWFIDRYSPTLEQAVLAEFINQGHFARHLRRMRALYIDRQAHLVEAARELLAGVLSVRSFDGGLHAIGQISAEVREDVLLDAAASVGVDLMPVSQFSEHPAEHRSVILGYAPYTREAMRESARLLRDAVLKRTQ